MIRSTYKESLLRQNCFSQFIILKNFFNCENREVYKPLRLMTNFFLLKSSNLSKIFSVMNISPYTITTCKFLQLNSCVLFFFKYFIFFIFLVFSNHQKVTKCLKAYQCLVDDLKNSNEIFIYKMSPWTQIRISPGFIHDIEITEFFFALPSKNLKMTGSGKMIIPF